LPEEENGTIERTEPDVECR